ncbi:hypothetical protein AAC387_Pa07g0637 [Persea americana]
MDGQDSKQNKKEEKEKKKKGEVQKSMDVQCMGRSMLCTPKWGPSCVTSANKNKNFRFSSRFFETQKFEFQSKGYWTFKLGIVQDCILPSMAHSYVMFGMKLYSDLKRFLRKKVGHAKRFFQP